MTGAAAAPATAVADAGEGLVGLADTASDDERKPLGKGDTVLPTPIGREDEDRAYLPLHTGDIVYVTCED